MILQTIILLNIINIPKNLTEKHLFHIGLIFKMLYSYFIYLYFLHEVLRKLPLKT